MPRLFVALAVPEPARNSLSTIQGGIEGARWVAPDNFHVTLRFIGEINNPQTDDVIDSLAGVRARSFELELAGVGCFQSRGRVRSVWAGITLNDGLLALQRKVSRAVADSGFPTRERNFHPHVTLARCKDIGPTQIRDFLETRAMFRADLFSVQTITLFESLLGSGSPVYRPVCKMPLGAA